MKTLVTWDSIYGFMELHPDSFFGYCCCCCCSAVSVHIRYFDITTRHLRVFVWRVFVFGR
ncbi:hypothetical protein BDV38DRAFT_235477 [Aspergillus pseudotamarii]|uniref:Uncharacterized protein n=1 Tax=Aspergillus pseudotamarii TaxID=132259 RepID=A0A5N6T8H4_ASPPS|nr:uncharacterized protein BDV38DRAFT_235477 [Aspergillus pseudotamarii]KAE8142678.1 hypothetical protein BDV38DRAFT_235477 [Aspergillus pseudotamarii]